MKKILKNGLFTFMLGALLTAGVSYGVYATTIASSLVTYSHTGSSATNVEGALNELYTRSDNPTSYKKFCTLKSTTYGSAGQVGSMYECDPGDGTLRNFYILSINNDNSVDMIMQRNISDGTTPTMTWYDAMKYINNNNLKNSWTNVLDIDLPKAQSIANASGISNWIAAETSATWWCFETKQQDTTSSPYCYNNDGNLETLWLWDYTRECASWNGLHSLDSTAGYGYWTRDAVVGSSYAWLVNRYGGFTSTPVSRASDFGVRPVITVYKNNLQ